MKNNKSVMIVHRFGNGNWWKSWDGTRHYTDEFSFQNSLFNCINQLGRAGEEIGIVFLDKEAHGLQDNEMSFRPVSSLDIEVLVKNSDIYYQVKWDDIPKALHEKVFSITKTSKLVNRVEFNMNDADHFLMWLEIKLFGIEVKSEV